MVIYHFTKYTNLFADESLPTTTEHIFGTSLDHVVEGIVGDTDPDVHHVISKNSNFTIVSLRSTIDIKEQPALAPPKIGKTCTHK